MASSSEQVQGCVYKKNKTLSNIIKKAINDISQQEKETIYNNWLYTEFTPYYKKPPFWIGILICLGLVLATILYVNKLLKDKIRKRTAELEIAIENANKSNIVKTRFIQNISHEIRTPLNSILGFSELLRKENITHSERSSYIDTITESGKSLIHVIDSILEISSFNNESAKINLEVINLKTIFENITSYFENIAAKKEVMFSLKTTVKNNDSVLIDRNRLKKITSNLIDNALKFTKKGSVEVTYELVDTNFLKIEVKDTGKGIKEQDREAIFDSFSQLENELSDDFNGLGLGLTIVKENINTLRGNISIESEYGKGTTFTVEIPCKKIAPSADSKHVMALEKTAYTILVVEDAEINFLLVKSILQRMEGFDFIILHAENGKIGVEMCDNHPEIDLVIMDIRMPVMNGYDATTLIKKKYPNLNVIAHTAYSSDADIKKALEVGCKTVLAKPIEMKAFKKTLIDCIGK